MAKRPAAIRVAPAMILRNEIGIDLAPARPASTVVVGHILRKIFAQP
jgi:hypothetical protein